MQIIHSWIFRFWIQHWKSTAASPARPFWTNWAGIHWNQEVWWKWRYLIFYVSLINLINFYINNIIDRKKINFGEKCFYFSKNVTSLFFKLGIRVLSKCRNAVFFIFTHCGHVILNCRCKYPRPIILIVNDILTLCYNLYLSWLIHILCKTQ